MTLYIYCTVQVACNVNYVTTKFWPASLSCPVMITLPALQTKIDTCANSVDPDETAHNEPSHQDLHCLPLSIGFWLATLFAIMDLSSFNDGNVHFINLGWKLDTLGRFSTFYWGDNFWLPVCFQICRSVWVFGAHYTSRQVGTGVRYTLYRYTWRYYFAAYSTDMHVGLCLLFTTHIRRSVWIFATQCLDVRKICLRCSVHRYIGRPRNGLSLLNVQNAGRSEPMLLTASIWGFPTHYTELRPIWAFLLTTQNWGRSGLSYSLHRIEADLGFPTHYMETQVDLGFPTHYTETQADLGFPTHYTETLADLGFPTHYTETQADLGFPTHYTETQADLGLCFSHIAYYRGSQRIRCLALLSVLDSKCKVLELAESSVV